MRRATSTLCVAVVIAGTFPARLALAQSTPPAPVTSLSATTISQTEIDLAWNANTTPTPNFPGTVTVFFSGPPSLVVGDLTLRGSGGVSGTDLATGAAFNGVTFDSAMSFSSGNSTITLTASGKGRMTGTGSLDGVSGAGQAAVQGSFTPVFARLAALRPATTYAGALTLTGNNSITSGGPLLVEGPLALAGNGDIGTPTDYMVVIVRPTSPSQLMDLVSLSGKGNIYGIVYVDLSLLGGTPLKLSGALLSITGKGSLHGILAVNGPNCPLEVASHMITGFTGNGGLLGGAVMQLNGTLVNGQGTSKPPGLLPLVSATGNGSAQYNSIAIASAYKVVVAASAPASFVVQRATQSGGPYTLAGNSTTTTFQDTGLSPGMTYYYLVQAKNAAGTSAVSPQVAATTLASPPTNVVTTAASQTGIDLSWSPSVGATSYVVSRASNPGGPYTLLGTTATTTFQDTGLSPGTTYYYVVQSVDSGGTSLDSSQVSGTTLATPPTNLSAAAVSLVEIDLTWSSSFGASSYVVSRGLQSGGPYTQAGTTANTSFQDTGLAPATTYFYVVQTVDAGGTSNYSAETSATTPPPTPVALAIGITPGSTAALVAGSLNAVTVRSVTTIGTTSPLFTGLVQLATTDARSPLNGLVLNFESTDQGSRTIPQIAAFLTAGSQTVTATTISGNYLLSGSVTVTVVPGPAAQIVFLQG